MDIGGVIGGLDWTGTGVGVDVDSRSVRFSLPTLTGESPATILGDAETQKKLNSLAVISARSFET